MNIEQLLTTARDIWGDRKITLSEIIVRLGVVYGDICRWQRNADKDKSSHTDNELKKELGNIIFSTLRWCDDLSYDPQECIQTAIDSQKKFAQQANV
ncbi:MAG: hypothetical protein HY454_02490 [Parcubacteria group bacterium]|nr:hypothetical protein [Parcubacteria group bacterium]